MADWTTETLRDRVLEHLGVKAAGEAATAEDANLAESAIEAAHARLRTRGLAPFSLTAIPPWAQIPLRDYVAGDLGRSFNLGDTLKPQQSAAVHDLREQCTIHRPTTRVRINSF